MTIQILINGILKGGLYGLMALGMSLIWGVMNIINIAHGAFIMVGAYITYLLFNFAGIDPFISLIFSTTAMFFIGYIIQRGIINLVIRAEIFITLILAFGIEIFINNAALLIFSADVRKVKVSYGASNFKLFGATIPTVRLIAFLLAVLITAILYFFMSRTKSGRAIRATSQDLDGAVLSGVKVSRIYALTFGLGTALAGAAGTLWAIIFPLSPTMGGSLTLKSFVVTIIGGLGTMLGPVIGGLTLGIVESFGTNWFGTTFESLISFSILVIILIVRPKGILGKGSE
ncbi:MAG: branched-chain amino acid ABC transporter permease [Acidobacteriota bacterium]